MNRTATAASVELTLGDTQTRLHAGDIVGRVQGARLLIDNPQVSEAHALVSLRRGRFVLLALRRLLVVDGVPSREVELAPGVEVGLAPDVALRVSSVHLPTRVLTVRSERLGQRRLGPEASLYGGEAARIVGRFERRAPCHVWSYGEGWRMAAGGPPQSIDDGSTVTIDGTRFVFETVDLEQAGVPSTQQPIGPFGAIRLVTYYDGVAVHRSGHRTLSIGGVGARIVSELAAFGGPVPWLTVAREVWDDATQRTDIELRQRWDTALRRLRHKLKSADVRADLIRSDGVGNVQLMLEPGDSVEDRS
ncbi:MAG: hypothetical protein AAGE52_30120 [Myxococcota bacterium]